MQLAFDVLLDVNQTGKLQGYDLYRSEQAAGKRPIIDGLYVQRSELGDPPPVKMRLTLEWEH